jgi:hypothetical protein
VSTISALICFFWGVLLPVACAGKTAWKNVIWYVVIFIATLFFATIFFPVTKTDPTANLTVNPRDADHLRRGHVIVGFPVLRSGISVADTIFWPFAIVITLATSASKLGYT